MSATDFQQPVFFHLVLDGVVPWRATGAGGGGGVWQLAMQLEMEKMWYLAMLL